tara:strand:+ start:1099 stop:2001 length:903 start_codon:yes stop_codon:yes gene_type:complete
METAIIKKHIQRAWGWDDKESNIFPGTLPVSVERRHFSVLQNNMYVVCEKSDGLRYNLVCTKIEKKRVAFLVNRSFQMMPVQLCFPRNAHEGTVLDGELINGKEFIAYDAVQVGGVDVKHMNLIDRIGYAENFITGIMYSKKDKYTISLKKFYPLYMMQEYITEHLPTVNHTSDGFIFTPVTEPVKTLTHERMFKWKPFEQITIDFKMKRKNTDIWGLYLLDRGQLIYESEIPDDGQPWMGEDVIVECGYVTGNGWRCWKPIHIRTDKSHPNNRKTYYRTLKNIKENIQLKEFVNLYNAK